MDYLGLGRKKFIGYPKQPTCCTIYTLENVEYQASLFGGEQPIKSANFPELELNAERIFRGD